MYDALPNAVEQPKDRFVCTPDRTHHRIGSPRLAISGQNKDGNVSRQNTISEEMITDRGLLFSN